MSTLVRMVSEFMKSDEHAAGVRRTLAEAIDKKQLSLKDLGNNYNRVFYECFGFSNADSWVRSTATLGRLEEAAGAVSTAAFTALTNPFVENGVMQAYDIPEADFSAIIPSEPTNKRFEIERGITHIGDEAVQVEEAKDYPEVGMSADWAQTPEVVKRGFIVSITKEAIRFDETGQVLKRAAEAMKWLRVNKEKRAIRCAIDQGETADVRYRYNWQGTAYSTYVDTPWDNLLASNALASYGDLEEAFLLLMAIVDPATGEPQFAQAKHLVVPPGLGLTAQFALTGQVRQTPGGFATSGTPIQTEIANPVNTLIGNVQVVGAKNQLLRLALGNSTTWFLGDLTEAFGYKEVDPLEMKNEGEDGSLAFQRDIVQRYRVREWGTYYTKNPRRVVKCTA